MSSDSDEEALSESAVPSSISQNNQKEKRKISKQDWEKEVKIKNFENLKKSNEIVANYLYIQGEYEALREFVEESGCQFEYKEDSLKKRFEIKKLILQNEIDKAIEKITLYSPDLLFSDLSVFFLLKKQKLIGYIKSNEVEMAIKYAKKELYPLVKNDEKLCGELERLLSILAFRDLEEIPDDESNFPEKLMLSQKHLESIANTVNLALINGNKKNEEKDFLKLEYLIKIMKHEQEFLSSELDFPHIKNLYPLEISEVKEEEKKDK